MMWGYGGQGVSWLWMLMMMIFGLLVVIGIVLLIVWAIRQGEHHDGGYRQQGPGGQHYGRQQHQQWQPAPPGAIVPGGPGGGQGMHGAQPRDPAVDAARERYARGEITKEQLDEVMRNLGY